MKDSVRVLACELKQFLSTHEEEDFIAAAAPQAAAGFSREDEAPTKHAAPAPAQDRLTVVFGATAGQPVQEVSVEKPVPPAPQAAPVPTTKAAPAPTPQPLPQGTCMTTEQKTAALDELAQQIKTCTRCPLGSTRLNAVPGEGNVNARLMFVGEGPGFDEDRQGRPFVGRAGQLLDKMIAAMGLKREDVFIANIAKCHPMVDPQHPENHGNDRAPNAEEIAFCRKYIEKQISIILPEYVVALGGVSAKALIADAKSLGALRGKFHNLSLDSVSLARPVKILATYHPAALLRNPGWKKDAWADLQMVMAAMGLKGSH